MNKQVIIGTIVMVAGLALVLFREKFAQDAVSFQNRAFGFRFGKHIIELGVLLAILFGVLLIFIGILVFAGIWQLK